MMPFPAFRCVLLVFCAGLAAGCGGTGLPPRAPVQGRVLYHGEPVNNATVTFMHEGSARWSIGTTNERGEFTLTTYDPGDGALLGDNKVTVAAGSPASSEPPPAVPDPETYFRSLEEAAKRPPPLPLRYAAPEQTNLQVTVEQGANHPVLELHD